MRQLRIVRIVQFNGQYPASDWPFDRQSLTAELLSEVVGVDRLGETPSDELLDRYDDAGVRAGALNSAR